jgi:hypothetical protein
VVRSPHRIPFLIELQTNIYVLGRDKLLVYTRYQHDRKVRLYALEPEHSEVGEYEKVVSNARKIWSFRFCCQSFRNGTSRLYFDGTNYRQTIAMIDGLFTLVIPASQVNKAILVPVSDFDLYRQGCNVQLYGLGLNRGCCRTNKQLYRLGYKGTSTGTAWESGATFDKRIHRFLPLLDSPLSFDEELGRLVSASRKFLVLQDFSLPLYNIADVYPNLDQIAAEFW